MKTNAFIILDAVVLLGKKRNNSNFYLEMQLA